MLQQHASESVPDKPPSRVSHPKKRDSKMKINPVPSISDLTVTTSEQLFSKINLEEKLENESHSEQLLLTIDNSLQTSIFIVDVLENGDFCYLALNPTHEKFIGIRSEELCGKKPEDILSPEDAKQVRQRYTDCIRFGKTISYEQRLQFQGITTWWSTTLTPLRDDNSRIYRLIGSSSNITPSKLVEQAGGLQVNRERLLEKITHQIILNYQNLTKILPEIVQEIRLLLDCDRLLVYSFQEKKTGLIIAESHINTVTALGGKKINFFSFDTEHYEHYKNGFVHVIEDVYTAELDNQQRNFLVSIEVRANLVVPILLQQNLWGLLISQHCQKTHQWQQGEIDFLKQISIQIGVAIHQAQLHQQITNLQAQLEIQKQHYTAQLEQVRNFDAIVRRITEQIRDNLEINPVLQTATLELTQLLQLERCQIEVYDIAHSAVTILCEYTTDSQIFQGSVRQISDFPQIYQLLLQKQNFHSVEIVPQNNLRWHPQLEIFTQLACPIFDGQGVLGNIWLIKPSEILFTDLEISLVQQVANECAIAMRQSQLYQKNQDHVQELENRERLKNEFLKTLSQELRTPMTSISLAAQTLEGLFTPEGILDIGIVPQLLQILQNECGRESKLINDLRTLAYLQIEPPSPTLVPIELSSWLRPILESFRDITSLQQQQLDLNIPASLPSIDIDITDFERIICELLNQVCKYTPAGESITVAIAQNIDTLELEFSSSGLEVSAHELAQIFQPFYRLGKNAPGKSSDSGLEMALVKGMVKRNGGSIYGLSADNRLIIMIKLPI